jgi:hypothetical protein
MGFSERIVFYGLVAATAIVCVVSPAHAQVKETVLWSFSGSDGFGPAAGVIADERGALYGTTQIGGAVNSPLCFGSGCGVVFKLTPPRPLGPIGL